MADKPGSYTANNYFYKPSLDAPYDTDEGKYERDLFEVALDTADAFLGALDTYISVNTTANSIQFGIGSSYTEIEADGTLEYHGGAKVWRDEKIRVGSAKLHPTATPSWATYQGGYVLTFDGAVDNTLYFEAQLNHDYAEGENVEFHIHYVPEDATAGNHRWKLGYTWASIGATFASQATVSKVIAAPGVANRHSVSTISATISGTNKSISSMIICELTRTASHASDTYNNKHIKLIGADFHYPCNTTGSREMYSK